jgi:hypothetical protein
VRHLPQSLQPTRGLQPRKVEVKANEANAILSSRHQKKLCKLTKSMNSFLLVRHAEITPSRSPGDAGCCLLLTFFNASSLAQFLLITCLSTLGCRWLGNTKEFTQWTCRYKRLKNYEMFWRHAVISDSDEFASLKLYLSPPLSYTFGLFCLEKNFEHQTAVDPDMIDSLMVYWKGSM